MIRKAISLYLNLKKMRKVLLGLFALLAVSVAAQDNVYEFSVKDAQGKDVSLSEYKGSVLLIVNTATKCGFTPQYKDLEGLYAKYKLRGFVVLDFPCNQFGEQAPGSISEIHEFCTANYDIQFPQFDKVDVNGKNEIPLFTYLKKEKGFAGFDLEDPIGKFLDASMSKKDPNYKNSPDIKWNFTKFLVDKNGKVIKRFEPTAKMSDVEAELLKLL